MNSKKSELISKVEAALANFRSDCLRKDLILNGMLGGLKKVAHHKRFTSRAKDALFEGIRSVFHNGEGIVLSIKENGHYWEVSVWGGCVGLGHSDRFTFFMDYDADKSWSFNLTKGIENAMHGESAEHASNCSRIVEQLVDIELHIESLRDMAQTLQKSLPVPFAAKGGKRDAAHFWDSLPSRAAAYLPLTTGTPR